MALQSGVFTETMNGMNERAIVRISWVAALCVAAASEFVPAVGLVAGFPLLIFVGGVHGEHPVASVAIMLIVNFAVVFATTAFLVRVLLRWFLASKTQR